jgi:hypothetical protein
MQLEEAHILQVRELMEYVDSKEDPVTPVIRNFDTT